LVRRVEKYQPLVRRVEEKQPRLVRRVEEKQPRLVVGQRRSRSHRVVLYPRVRALQANEMAGKTQNDSKFEVRAVVKFLQAEGVRRSETHRRSESVCDQNVFIRKGVSVWCNRFKNRRTALNDDPEKHGQTKDLAH
jgi:hypothetical protein